MSPVTPLMVAHASAAGVALPLGAYQILRTPRGDRLHRRVGWVWVVLMIFVAGTSFGIRNMHDGAFSLLHVLSVVTLVSVTLAMVNARRGRIARHRVAMVSSWLGLLGAFVPAVVVPTRMIPVFVLTEPVGALLAALATVLVAGLIVLAARGLDRAVLTRGAPR